MSQQHDLFERFAEPLAEPKTEQKEQLDRVTSRIGKCVLEFVRSRKSFFAAELHEHVVAKTQSAPASADRILRELRRKGIIDYEVDRARSHYTILK